MRLDYVSYAVAIVFFVVTLAAVVYTSELQQQVWVVSTVVIGLAFIGLGYTQRPKPAAAPPMTTSAPPPPPSEPLIEQEHGQQQHQMTEATTALSQPMVTGVVKVEETKPVVPSVEPTAGGLTTVKGIGEKRAAQLKALGISSVEDLAKASPRDLATKLNISAKITDKWIKNATEIGQKP